MGTVAPRAVIVTRPTDLEALLVRHGTRAQAAFFLKSQGQTLDEILSRHQVEASARHQLSAAIPKDWRRAQVGRTELDRFLFEPEDVILAVGQDGLVANVAKYLHGQPVVGVNPAPDRIPGVLARHPVQAVADLLAASRAGRLPLENRTMVEARLSDGQRLLALNEIFVGHRSHQSARYRIHFGEREERQSSSGVLIATGTGATGWAKSVARGRPGCPQLPKPTSAELVFLVREAWPSPSTFAELVHGQISGAPLSIVSEMNDGGVCFGDGIEGDYLDFGYGQVVTVGRAPGPLLLAA
ncbi:MAG: NAD(+)/NADH kinase [Deltaproteobacteria bacterium]|nr:NAD(+)/NADH kinase [Deltaproteobacteria bacterium]